MTDRPTIFSGPMVRALLDDRKTQTRRLASSPLRRCQVGDRLWVRERTMVEEIVAALKGESLMLSYEADGVRTGPVPLPARLKRAAIAVGKRLSMGCFREASRLTLIVEAVRFQRLQEISEEDAIAEGVVWTEPTAADREWARVHAEEDGGDASIDGVWTVPGLPSIKGLPADVGHVTAPLCYGRLWDMLHTKPGECWHDNPEIVALTFRVVRANIDSIDKEPRP